MQECFKRGILSFGVHFINYAMTEADVDTTLAAYDEIFPILGAAVAAGDCRRFLECEPLIPLFKVR
jgi:glutamate-1-semialdehyde 2,1-aminomutase